MKRKLEFVRIPAVLARNGKSESAFYRAVKAGTHTPPVKIGAKSAAIPSHEIDALMSAEVNGATPEQLRKLVGELLAQRKALMPRSLRAPESAQAAA